jgi:hypothetical protein
MRPRSFRTWFAKLAPNNNKNYQKRNHPQSSKIAASFKSPHAVQRLGPYSDRKFVVSVNQPTFGADVPEHPVEFEQDLLMLLMLRQGP